MREPQVDLSVLIATRNRADVLARTLEGLTRQDLGGRSWEAVVVDNGSSDDTAAVIRAASGTLPLRRVTEPRPGKNVALNTGLREVHGALVVFADDDILPEPDWLRTLADAADRWPEDNVFGGRIDPHFPPSTPAWLAASTFPHGRWAFSTYHPRPTEGPTGETPLGPNMAIRACRLREVRFDETMGPRGDAFPMGSEVELLLRLYRAGEQFIYVPTARVRHVIAPSHVEIDTLAVRAFRCGRGNARLFGTEATFPFFGVPLHQWMRATKAGAARVRAVFGSDERRALARLEWRQVLGNMTEYRSMLDRGMLSEPDAHGRYRHFPRPGAVWAAVRRHGAVAIAGRLVRAALRPLVRYRRVLLLTDDVANPSALPDVEGVDVEVYQGPECERAVLTALSRLETLPPGAMQDRLRRGDSVAIAYGDGTVLGYAWAAFRDLPVSEIGRTLRVPPDTVVGYDGHIARHARGRRLLGALDHAQMHFARSRGRTRQWVFLDGSNRPSRRAMHHMGKRPVATLHHLVVPLLGVEHVRVGGTDEVELLPLG